jgi:hypothetical protein
MVFDSSWCTGSPAFEIDSEGATGARKQHFLDVHAVYRSVLWHSQEAVHLPSPHDSTIRTARANQLRVSRHERAMHFGPGCLIMCSPILDIRSAGASGVNGSTLVVSDTGSVVIGLFS